MREIHRLIRFGIIGLLMVIGRDQMAPRAFSQVSTPNATFPEAEEALKKFRVEPGFKVDVFAAEPFVANPVSFAFDERGRMYVVETFRRRTSVYDIRRHPDWLDDDFSFRTVKDRADFFKRVLQPDNKALPPAIVRDMNGDGQFDYRDLEVESERIRLLEDENGDGRADRATIFADGFNTSVSGVAAGVLAKGSNVWFTCIPDLWQLRDVDGDGRADERKSLLTGFGVHISFGGHDLHGLRFGPDGKLYFSIADRGLHVVTRGRAVSYPDSGAIMRCNPDGSDFEIYAYGLRNPQELAFDQYGNLWTGDNNGDGGDKARWVYALEGSDSGWHLGWQHLPKMGPWNSEKLWELSGTNTAAYILPPVAHIGHGPAGLAFYPGTGLPARYDNHFFMCDFPGGVRSFSLVPNGSAYTVTNLHDFLWGLSPVDVDFGPDGGVYVADWIQGWEKTGKGRVYRVLEPSVLQDALLDETKKLLAQGMGRRSPAELAALLAHRDQRVRLEAQFALADRGGASSTVLSQVAQRSTNRLARLHAIWGLGQIARTNSATGLLLTPLLSDPDGEVRAQTARVMGNARYQPSFQRLIGLLRDPEPRVRLFAAMSLGKFRNVDAIEPIMEMIRANADADPYLRHAGVMGLVGSKDLDELLAFARDPSRSVRMAVLLALRRMERPEISLFLHDSDTNLVLEAARAVNDLPLEPAFTQLASLSSKTQLPEPVLRRALNAHFRLGKLENALSLAEFAANETVPDALRADALTLLGMWEAPPKRDWVVGLWRPLPERESRAVMIALRTYLPKLMKNAPDPVRTAGIQTAVKAQMRELGSMLYEMATNHVNSLSVRSESLKGLAAFKDRRLADALSRTFESKDEALRKEALRLLPEGADDASSLRPVLTLLQNGSVGERQIALQRLGKMNQPEVEREILGWLDKMTAGEAPKEMLLDLREAAAARTNSTVILAKLKQYESSKPANDPLGAYRETLFGGDAANGRKLFFERAEAGCLRCHKIKGEGGEVGPDLQGIGVKQNREYILESILYPNRNLAPGFETVVIVLKNGSTYAGTVKSETERDLILNSPEDGIVAVSKENIVSRERGLSAMPEELGNLFTQREIRDLVEFLARLK